MTIFKQNPYWKIKLDPDLLTWNYWWKLICKMLDKCCNTCVMLIIQNHHHNDFLPGDIKPITKADDPIVMLIQV